MAGSNQTSAPNTTPPRPPSYVNILYDIISKYISSNGIFDNKNNMKYVFFCISAIFAYVLASALYYLIFAYACLKCMIWLLDEYTPEKTMTPADEVLEYMVVPITIVLVTYPLQFTPVSLFSPIVNVLSIMTGLTCTTNRVYRQKLCIFLRDLFTSRHKNSEGVTIKGTDGGFYNFLQVTLHCIESICIGTINITYNPRYMVNKICSAKDLKDIILLLMVPVSADDLAKYNQNTNNGNSTTPS